MIRDVSPCMLHITILFPLLVLLSLFGPFRCRPKGGMDPEIDPGPVQHPKHCIGVLQLWMHQPSRQALHLGPRHLLAAGAWGGAERILPTAGEETEWTVY